MTDLATTDNPVYLSMCASCGAYPAGTVYATDVPHPHPFHCPRCRRGLLTGEEQLATEYPVVRFVGDNPYVRWCVLDIQDDGFFLARRLGLPDSPTVRRHVTEIQPIFSYTKLAKARR